MELPEKLEKFCLLYYKTNNATKSYLESYGAQSDNSAAVSASKLIRSAKVKERLKELKADMVKEHKVTIEQLVELNRSIAFSRLSDVVKVDSEGNADLIPDCDIDSLDGFSFSKSESQTEDGFTKTKSFSVRRPDRVKAAQELARLIGAYDKSKTDDDEGTEKSSIESILGALRKFKK